MVLGRSYTACGVAGWLILAACGATPPRAQQPSGSRDCEGDWTAPQLSDEESSPHDFARGPGRARDIVADDTHVYWSMERLYGSTQEEAARCDALMRRAQSGGAVTPLATGRDIGSFTVGDDGRIYFIDRAQGTVERTGGKGSEPETLATAGPSAGGLVVVEESLYWSVPSDSPERPVLRTMPTGGGTPRTVTDSSLSLLVGPYLRERARNGAGSKRDVLDIAYISAEHATDGRVVRLRRNGILRRGGFFGHPLSVSVLMALGPPGTGRLTVGHDHIYWTNQSAGSVYGVSTGASIGLTEDLSARSEQETIARDESRPYDVVFKDGYLYWTADGAVRRMRIDHGGGAPT